MSYDASNIKILKGIEHVRTRPAMYIGSTNVKGLNHLVYEIVDNSVDEFAQGYGNTIEVTLEPNGMCTVRDYGRGIPVDIHKDAKVSALRVVLTTLNAGGKFDNSSYSYSSGLHGVGSSVVNALSSKMEVKVFKNGKCYSDSYEKGIPTTTLNKSGSLPSSKTSEKDGTLITFLPDNEIFKNTEFKASDIQTRLHETAYLNPGLTIKFEDKRPSTPVREVYHEPRGILQYLEDINKSENCICNAYKFEGQYKCDIGVIKVEVAFQYIESLQEKIVGFCNNVLTQEGGSHVTALKSSLTTLINQYARQLGFLKDKDPNFSGTDVRSGFTSVVVIKHPDPQFEGQTKTKLDNQDAYSAVLSICSNELKLYFDRNLSILKKVLNIASKSSKLRKSEAKVRSSLFNTTKKKYSFDSNGKLAGCESKDYSKNELFIVEGDSAAGSGKIARDRQFQAILPIRGKILNVEKASIEDILKNEEIKTIIYALGCGFLEGYGQDFDISKLKYNKIIFMTDSDSDGDHISTLLCTLFYRLFPELIYNGNVYVACPPLYRATPSKGDSEYLYTDKDLQKYRKTHKSFILQRYKGLGEMNPNQLWETTMNPNTRRLKKVVITDEIKASNTTSNLMGKNVDYRRKFIQENATKADIDV